MTGDLVPDGKVVELIRVVESGTVFCLGASFTQGRHNFVERIELFEVPGEMAMVPWFRVIDSREGEVFIVRASLCEVFLRPTPDTGEGG